MVNEIRLLGKVVEGVDSDDNHNPETTIWLVKTWPV